MSELTSFKIYIHCKSQALLDSLSAKDGWILTFDIQQLQPLMEARLPSGPMSMGRRPASWWLKPWWLPWANVTTWDVGDFGPRIRQKDSFGRLDRCGGPTRASGRVGSNRGGRSRLPCPQDQRKAFAPWQNSSKDRKGCWVQIGLF